MLIGAVVAALAVLPAGAAFACDPLDPSATLALDNDLLARFPEGYRHLAYLQTRIGYTVKPDMPGLDGPEVEALYGRGDRWLKGEKI